MSAIRIEVATKDLNSTLKGSYRKRKAMIWNYGDGSVTVSHDPHWSGGSKEEHAFFRLTKEGWVRITRDAAGVTSTRKREDGTPIVGLAGPYTNTTLHNDVVCVETGYFCGKPAIMRIYTNGDCFMWLHKEPLGR